MLKKKWVRVLLGIAVGSLLLVLSGLGYFYATFDLMGTSERYDEEVCKWVVSEGGEVLLPSGATGRYEAFWGFTDGVRAVCFRASEAQVRAFAKKYAGKPLEAFEMRGPEEGAFLLYGKVKNARRYWRPYEVKKGWCASEFKNGRGWDLLVDLENGLVYLVEFST